MCIHYRYIAEQGDVVIGRVTEVQMHAVYVPKAATLNHHTSHVKVAGKRWKIDLKSRQEAGLLLSAVNLPGGIQVMCIKRKAHSAKLTHHLCPNSLYASKEAEKCRRRAEHAEFL